MSDTELTSSTEQWCCDETITRRPQTIDLVAKAQQEGSVCHDTNAEHSGLVLDVGDASACGDE
jgi:hypothetical protein